MFVCAVSLCGACHLPSVRSPSIGRAVFWNRNQNQNFQFAWKQSHIMFTLTLKFIPFNHQNPWLLLVRILLNEVDRTQMFHVPYSISKYLYAVQYVTVNQLIDYCDTSYNLNLYKYHIINVFCFIVVIFSSANTKIDKSIKVPFQSDFFTTKVIFAGLFSCIRFYNIHISFTIISIPYPYHIHTIQVTQLYKIE